MILECFNLQLKVFKNPEEKRRELEEAGRQEEKLLAEARRRSGTGHYMSLLISLSDCQLDLLLTCQIQQKYQPIEAWGGCVTGQ